MFGDIYNKHMQALRVYHILKMARGRAQTHRWQGLNRSIWGARIIILD
jgi:hypothetical protein